MPRDTDDACAARYREALTVYQQGYALHPDNPELISGLSWSLAKLQQDLDTALVHARSALAYRPWSPVLQYRTGYVYNELGDNDKARHHLSRALYWSEDRDLSHLAGELLATLEDSP